MSGTEKMNKKFKYFGIKCSINQVKLVNSNESKLYQAMSILNDNISNYHNGYIHSNNGKLKKIFSKFEEITYETDQCIGFDTIHVHNTRKTQTEKYVHTRLKKIIDRYRPNNLNEIMAKRFNK